MNFTTGQKSTKSPLKGFATSRRKAFSMLVGLPLAMAAPLAAQAQVTFFDKPPTAEELRAALRGGSGAAPAARPSGVRTRGIVWDKPNTGVPANNVATQPTPAAVTANAPVTSAGPGTPGPAAGMPINFGRGSAKLDASPGSVQRPSIAPWLRTLVSTQAACSQSARAHPSRCREPHRLTGPTVGCSSDSTDNYRVFLRESGMPVGALKRLSLRRVLALATVVGLAGCLAESGPRTRGIEFNQSAGVPAVAAATATVAAVPVTRETPRIQIDTGSHAAPIRGIALSPDQSLVVTVSDDKTGRIWDSATGQLRNVLRAEVGNEEIGRLYAVAIHPTQDLVALAGTTGS